VADKKKKEVQEHWGICAKCGQAIVDEKPVTRRKKHYHPECVPTLEEEKRKSRSYT
jgi:hypothetical protein